MRIHNVFSLLYYISKALLVFISSTPLNRTMYPNTDEYEYPKANETLRQIYKRQWLDYYECLKAIYASIGYRKSIYPSALIALEGTSVTLECQICTSPVETSVDKFIIWYFNSSVKNIVKNLVEGTDYIVASPENQYIIIHDLKFEQAGWYWCEMGDTTGSLYYLQIDNEYDQMNIVYPDTALYALQATSPEIVIAYDLKIHTTWTTWSSCSVCDIVGIKLRYGYCTISLLTDSIQRHIANNEYRQYQMDKSESHETIINENVKVRLRTILLLFKNQLPCKSLLVPKQIQTMPTISNRKTEVMRRYCKKKCMKNIIFEVRDEKNNVLESANNSAGIYSMFQGIPEPSPSLTRRVMYKKRNTKVRLICPGNLNTNVPIIWQIGDKVIIPSRIKYQSNGRIYMNSQMHILFRSLRYEDANIYSCLQNNELAGIIKLIVIEEIELKVSNRVILSGAIIIIGVFILIFWRAFKSRTRFTIY